MDIKDTEEYKSTAALLDKITMKHETLEEAAFRIYPRLINDPYNPTEDDNKEWREEFIAGAKWQQEQMEKLKDFDTWKEWKNTGIIGLD